MSAEKPLFVQLVELLTVTEAVANDQPVIVITIRPDPPNFVPHNIALTKAQAWRLARDLENLLVPFVLLVSLFLATTAGCGARVELESAKWDSSSGETARAAVEVDLLRSQPTKPVAKTEATELPPKPAVPADKPAHVAGNTIIVNIRGGDVTYNNETHIHVCERPASKVEGRIVVYPEIQAEPPRRGDPRCERLAREREEWVRRWREFPFGQ
jgi:hypothetical protein